LTSNAIDDPTYEEPRSPDPAPGGRPSDSLLVRRSRLLHGLLIRPAAVSLVCAPAGSGKTALVQHLITTPGSVPTGYVDMGRIDPTPQAVWSAILESLTSLDVYGPTSPMHEIRPPEGIVPSAFVDRVVAAIAAGGRVVRLVLDDLHVIDDPHTLENLDRLVARQPDELLLVLSTRHDPPLALHRPRLAGRLREFREKDLAFREDELVELLERAGCELDAAGVELLRRRTEGWAAGIRFAVLSLLAGADPEELLNDFGGHDRAIADYLMAEVLTQQTDEMRTFLLATSACSTLPVELAVQLSGRRDAGDVLDGLVRRHALTELIDQRRRVYRYHAVLRTYLDAERRRRRPEFEAELQRSAGQWHAARGDWLTALEHLVDADDPDLLMALLRDHAVTIMLDGQIDRLERVFERLPAHLQREPSITLLHALFAPALVRPPPVADALADLDLTAMADSEDHLLRTLSALIRVQRASPGEIPETALLDLENLAALPTGSRELDLIVRHQLGSALLWSGRAAEGSARLVEVTERARTNGRDALAVSALGQLANAALMVEELDRAETLALEATSIAARRGWVQVPHVLPAHIALMWIGYQRVDRDTARRELDHAVGAIGPDTDPRVRRTVETCQLVIRMDGGDTSYPLLRDHRALVRGTRVEMPPQYHASFGPLLVWAALRLGETGWATDLSHEHGGPQVAPGEQQLMRSMLLHAAGHDAATAKAVDQIVDGRVEVALRSTLIHAHLLAATLALRRATPARAHGSLLAALRIGDETGIVRPFLNIGPEVHEQLIASADRSGHLASLARHIIELTGGGSSAKAPVSLLTPSEINILRDLPSLLTIRDIAASRSISTNTVKTHLSAIYRKLGVNGRREAVEMARRRGLL
jgi:LuxR family transcriptional regulator, maltose regulon positive regulatory protein